jgi:AcrR family transcriptional regulator
MRLIAKKVGIAQSVLYYYFADKDDLLKAVYLDSNRLLGQRRAALPPLDIFENMLKQRIEFQFDEAESVCAVLKYYLHFRTTFKKNVRGHLPEKTYLHIEEILSLAEQKGLYQFPDLEKEAKVIVHAINGFILEYFPSPLDKQEKVTVINDIAHFILRALEPYKKVSS